MVGRVSIGLLRSGPPALPRALFLPAAAAVVLSTTVFAVLAARYGGGARPGRLDDRSQLLVDSALSGRIRPVGLLIGLGDPTVVVVTAVLLAGLCLWLGRRRLALLAIAGPGLTGLVTTLTKPLVDRTLDGDLAYPSGHTGGATALGLVAALLVVSLLEPRPAGGVLTVAGGGLVAGGGMAILLVARDWHYPTDTIGGFCAAVAAVLGSALILEMLALRRGAQVVPANSANTTTLSR